MSGVRRSWLAQATSSRRASKSRSIDSAIALNDPPICASSRAPSWGARVARSPAASWAEAARSRSSGFTIQRASSNAPTTAESAAADETARILASSCMWNITQPEARTPAEGEHDREQREPGELQADGRQQPEQKRRDDPDGDGAEREEDGDLGHGVNR